MGIEASYAARHGRPNEVLGDVEVDQGGGGSLQHRADDVCGNNGLGWKIYLRLQIKTLAIDLTSATTDFPLPSTQLTAAGFLSVQKFPEREIISMSGKTS